MSLRFDPLDSIAEEGVKLKSGEVVPVDVIIFGTGYEVVSNTQSVPHAQLKCYAIVPCGSQGSGQQRYDDH